MPAVFQTEDEAKVYLTQMAETVPSLSHVNTYIKIIARKISYSSTDAGGQNHFGAVSERNRMPTCFWKARSKKFMKFARDAIPMR